MENAAPDWNNAVWGSFLDCHKGGELIRSMLDIGSYLLVNNV